MPACCCLGLSLSCLYLCLSHSLFFSLSIRLRISPCLLPSVSALSFLHVFLLGLPVNTCLTLPVFLLGPTVNTCLTNMRTCFCMLLKLWSRQRVLCSHHGGNIWRDPWSIRNVKTSHEMKKLKLLHSKTTAVYSCFKILSLLCLLPTAYVPLKTFAKSAYKREEYSCF